ncbi:MAG TPA: phosphotransferase family protein [Tepidiformaceae bacterium]|nr:phosphotransferase family protein [Tepidiformaceae bacterium]
MTSEVPAGIKYDNVSRFFAEHVPGGNVPLSFSLISGGRSNLTYKVMGGDQTWVLRRPPLGHVLPTAHDMAREFKVLSGLAKASFPAPTPIAFCADAEVNDYPFYVMDYREGVIIAEAIPRGYATTDAERQAMASALVRTLVELHAIDYETVGLGDFGRPEGYLERQVRRWSEQWARSETRPMPEIDEVIRRLRNSIPKSPKPTIVHGDYRLGNMMLAPDDPGRVVAVLDWEMATLGDPLSDLGYTLSYWQQADDSPEVVMARGVNGVTAAPGFPSRKELVAEYARLSGRDVSMIEWYEIFASYKLAVIVEGIHARFLAGETVGAGFEGYGQRAEALVRQALAATEKAEDAKLRGVA